MSKKILIVDDDGSIREVLSRYLSKQGFDIETATNGQEGVDKARIYHPDLIMMDVLMPRMDGRTAARAIRKIGSMQNVPILFLTATHAETGYSPAKERQTDFMVGKPFDFKKLSELTRQILSKNA